MMRMQWLSDGALALLTWLSVIVITFVIVTLVRA
jgi:hypothetical protein